MSSSDSGSLSTATSSSKAAGPGASTSSAVVTPLRPLFDEGIDLMWTGLRASVQVPDADAPGGCCRSGETKTRPILKGVSGSCARGELLFLMGPSGCGKTTTLNFLAGRLGQSVDREGAVFLNGAQATEQEFREHGSVVTQDDILLNELTPYEQVLFTARMHLGGISDAERKDRVLTTLKFLNLERCMNTPIGEPGLQRGISGGERKRVNIANSLIVNPSLLFLDEPTSGLDSDTALQVVSLLATLAHTSGKAIVATLHQPSVEMLELADKIVLLVDGSVAFSGPYSTLTPYFETLGFEFPTQRNPMDIAMSILTRHAAVSPDLESARIARVVDAFASTEKSSGGENSSSALPAPAQRPGLASRLRFLLQRSLHTQLRNKLLTRARLVQTIVLSLVVGAIFWQLDRGQTGGQDRLGFVFLVTINQFILSLMGVISTLPKERAVALREIMNGSYSPSLYFVCKINADLPFQLVFPAMFSTVVYWMAGLENDVSKYFIFIGTICLVSNIGSGIGFLVAALTGDTSIALSIAPASILPMMLFSGFVVRINSIPGFLRWISFVNPFRYAFMALTRNELEDITFTCSGRPGGVCPYPTGDALLEIQDLKQVSIWKCEVILLAFFVAVRLGGLLAMNTAVVRKRRRG